MNSRFLKIVASALPESVKKKILYIKNRFIFDKAFKEFISLKDYTIASDSLLKKLVVGWGNQGFSSQITYLKSCLKAAVSNSASILECGSGLSTILIAVAVRNKNIEYHVFEHNDFWVKRMKKELSRLGISNVQIHHTILISKGPYDWYDFNAVRLPANFGMVICDGPPAQTKGGRFGLIPEMNEKLIKGSVILLDDTIRTDEREVIDLWVNQRAMDVEFINDHDQHAIITLK